MLKILKKAFDNKLWNYSFFGFMNVMYGLLFYCSFQIFYYFRSNITEGGNMQQIQTQINVVLTLQVHIYKNVCRMNFSKSDNLDNTTIG
jgi:ribonucleotide reductase beta subunit family protein with ferritin-like domain